MFKSVRAQLAISFGAIALLAAVLVGVLLLWVLRDYYTRQEQAYLNNNAITIGFAAADLFAPNVSAEARQAQLQNYAFLSQTRVRLLDAESRLLADTGVVRLSQVSVGVMQEPDTALSSTVTARTFITVDNVNAATISVQEKGAPFFMDAGPVVEGLTFEAKGETTEMFGVKGSDVVFITTIPARATAYGFQLGGEASLERRSPEKVRQTVLNGTSQVLGYVELSDGPAYGQEILDSVRRGWMIASVFAVLLAGAVGLGISQRISAPVRALTAAVEQMYAGDLSARVAVRERNELGQLAAAFNAMSARVENTIQTLQRFVLDAAHELQTPLTALRTNLDLAAGDSAPEQRADDLRQAQAQVERLSRLTTSLLDLSRLEATGRAERFELVDLGALLREASELYAARAEQAEVGFTLEIEAGAPAVMGNAVQLRSALSNLLENAVKFTPAGGQVTARLSAADGGALLCVTDTGVGVPPDELELVFHRFHRGRNAAGAPGSGLGLAIVRATAQAHGGWVSAANRPEGGARFTLWLPGGEG